MLEECEKYSMRVEKKKALKEIPTSTYRYDGRLRIKNEKKKKYRRLCLRKSDSNISYVCCFLLYMTCCA